MQQISFAILGMHSACPKSAGDIERVLAQLDGVVAAQVNYATERAMVVYDPTRVKAFKMLSALRGNGYDTPVEHLTLLSDELLYATSARTVENVLRQAEGIVDVCADLAGRRVTLEVLPEYCHRHIAERILARLGFQGHEADSANAQFLFLMRSMVLVAIEFLAVWSAGAHAGLFVSPSSLHAPLVVLVISVIALFGAGLPLYRFAYGVALLGEFDPSVLLALLASVFALGSLPVGILSPSPWLTNIGFVVAMALTTSWFMARALTLWVFPHFRRIRRKVNLVSAAQTQLGVVSDGSRR